MRFLFGSAGAAYALTLLLIYPRLAAATDLYVTSFEQTEGFIPTANLSGQQGWTNFGSGGNGMISDPFFGPGQQAYIGYEPPIPADTVLSLWRPINYFPPTNALVTFSVKMQFIDSTNGFYDDFRWSIYNNDSVRLFSIDFDNSTLDISYGIDTFVQTGRKFTNEVLHTLAITLDFPMNRWSALFDGTSLVTNSPLTTKGAALNLGDIDAVWAIRTQGSPGNNYMLFDDYRIQAQTPSSVAAPFRLSPLGKSSNGPFLLRLAGEPGRDYAIDVTTNFTQWSSVRTNTTSTDGTFDYVDTQASALSRRFYRARLVR